VVFPHPQLGLGKRMGHGLALGLEQLEQSLGARLEPLGLEHLEQPMGTRVGLELWLEPLEPPVGTRLEQSLGTGLESSRKSGLSGLEQTATGRNQPSHHAEYVAWQP
jgi:hypothetical protein